MDVNGGGLCNVHLCKMKRGATRVEGEGGRPETSSFKLAAFIRPRIFVKFGMDWRRVDKYFSNGRIVVERVK